MIAETIPGKNPASKSCPTDSSTIIAYITKMALGGIKVARVPPAAKLQQQVFYYSLHATFQV